LLVDTKAPWIADLEPLLAHHGYAVMRIGDIRAAPVLLTDGGVLAVLLDAGRLEVRDVLAIRQCRRTSPDTAVVIVANAPAQPDLAAALESGATAVLPWPAPLRALRKAICSGRGALSAGASQSDG
jgi:DNA-binding response OmpR family regulator